MRRTRTPEALSLGKLLKEIDELLYVVQRLNHRAVGEEEATRQELEGKLTEARRQLAERIIQRTL